MNAKLAPPPPSTREAPTGNTHEIRKPGTLYSTDLAVAIAEVSNPLSNLGLQRRRVLLAQQLARATRSDAWLWLVNSNCYHQDSGRRRAKPSSVQGTGFASPQQRAELLRFLTQNSGKGHLIETWLPLATNGKSVALSRAQVSLALTNGKSTDFEHQLHECGVDDFVVCGQVKAPQEYSSCMLMRFRDRSTYSRGEIDLVSFVFNALNWLHSFGDNPQQSDPSIPNLPALSRRERQVTDLVLAGYTRKQMATSLGLSEHTIVDYLKNIYRKFGVRTRAQLQAHCGPNSVPHDSL